LIKVLLYLALAATPVAQNADLQHALKAYDDLDYDKAGRLFDQVLWTGDLSPADQKIADFYAGIVYFDLSQTDKAHDAFTKALQLDSSLALDADASPKLQEFFAAVKKELAANPPPKVADVPAGAQPDQKASLTPNAKSKSDSDFGDLDDQGTSTSKPLYQKPLLWVGVGAVVVAAVVVIVLVTHHGASCTATGNNGCIDVQVQRQGLAQW
jgi:tetratricopeptide (TPR) repeat protein